MATKFNFPSSTKSDGGVAGHQVHVTNGQVENTSAKIEQKKAVVETTQEA